MNQKEFPDPIDLYFAKKVLRQYPNLPQESLSFFANLMAFSRSGHICLKMSDLCKIDSESEKMIFFLREFLQANPKNFPVFEKNGRFYLQRNWVYETRFLSHCKRLMQTIPDEIQDFQMDPKLNCLQKEAIVKVIRHPLSLITGGPGTGKTYTAAKLIESLHLEKECRIVLTAPTGKAAARLEAGIGKRPNIQCGTLHSLLGIRSSRDFEEEGSILLADLVIVDECSMIDVRLFAHLLASLKEGCRLILMGDADQLPSIESGSVFADLIDASREGFPLPCTHLQMCMRSERKSCWSWRHPSTWEMREKHQLASFPIST